MKRNGRPWKALQSKGFTLVECIVTLTILGIFAAITVPNITAYFHHAQFQRNEAYAKTLYFTAETNLTHLRASGLWEDFEADLLSAGEWAGVSETHEILGVLLNGCETESEAKERIRACLIDIDTFDSKIRNAYICIEVDVTSGHVYSVFYSTTTGALSYEPGTDGYLGSRDYASRSERRLGGYLTTESGSTALTE